MLCIFCRSVGDHALALQSNNMVDSTTACTMRALVRFFKDDLQSHLLTFVQVVYPLLIPAARSSFFPNIVPSMRVFSEASQPKAITSPWPSWHFSSQLSISALMTSFPLANSSSNPSKVESSAKRASSISKALTLLTSSSALRMVCVASQVDLPSRNPFWFSSRARFQSLASPFSSSYSIFFIS